MGRSSRKPYIGWEGPRKFFATPSRHLKESNSKESSFEKPYDVANYNLMHQEPNIPTVPDGALNPGGIEISFVDGACGYGIKAIAGIDIPTIGGPEEDKAGWLKPECLEGEIISWKTSGPGLRRIDIILSEGQLQNTVKVTFKDGWGMLHSRIVTVLCSPIYDYFYSLVTADSGGAYWDMVERVFYQGDTPGKEYYYAGNFFDNPCDMYIRFSGVNIPQGTTIGSAIIGLGSIGDTDPVVNLNCYFEDSNEAINPTTLGEFDSLSLTGAVAWNTNETWGNYVIVETPELKSILQTVVDRVGWTASSAMLVLKNNGSDTNKFKIVSIGYYLPKAYLKVLF